MSELTHRLGAYSNVVAVSEALLKLCTPYGAVVRLQILTASYRGQQQALCFLRLTSTDAEDQLMQALGAQRCDGRLVIVVPLQAAIQPIQLRPSAATSHTLTHHNTLESPAAELSRQPVNEALRHG